MQIIKYAISLLIIYLSTLIGVLISKRYINRLNELREIKNALNILKTKIRYTYEPLPEIFNQISISVKKNIGKIFLRASEKMDKKTAEKAWLEAIEQSNTNLKKEDIDILKGLSNLLGKTNVEGQISEIDLTTSFIDNQIKQAENEKNKNEKLYKKLGTTIGIAIVIIIF